MTSTDGMKTLFSSKNTPKYVGNIDDIMTAINALDRLKRLNQVMNKQMDPFFASDQLLLEVLLDAFLAPAVAAVANTMNDRVTIDHDSGKYLVVTNSNGEQKWKIWHSPCQPGCDSSDGCFHEIDVSQVPQAVIDEANELIKN